MVAAIKICLEKLFSKKSYRIETARLICKEISWLTITWYKFLLKGIFEQTIVQVFFKDILIFKKQSNIDSLNISYRLTLPFRLNSSKWKALYWVECYANCYVYFNRLSLLTSFLIMPFGAVTKWYLTHYSSLVIILFEWVYVGLYFLSILLNTSFPSFWAFSVNLFWIKCFESGLIVMRN